MDVKIANALSGYFETLYDANVKLIKLCGINLLDVYANDERLVFSVIQNIYRLFPCKKLREEEKLILDKTSGLFEFADVLDYLEDDFLNILKDNNEFLDSIRQIRNKYQHKRHAVKIVGAGSGTWNLFDFAFEVDGKEICLYTGDFIKFLSNLNSVYAKMQREVEIFAYENNKTDYAYYKRLSRFNFNDFYKIYHDTNLILIGKLMHNF